MPERPQPLPLTSTSVGFVGGRRHLTVGQLVAVRFLLDSLGAIEVHHGNEVGADEDIHRLADEIRAWRMVHPCQGTPEPAGFLHDVVFAPQPLPLSDHAIVDSGGALIVALDAAVPEGDGGSRTIQAVHYARSKGKTVVLVAPSGTEQWLRHR